MNSHWEFLTEVNLVAPSESQIRNITQVNQDLVEMACKIMLVHVTCCPQCGYSGCEVINHGIVQCKVLTQVLLYVDAVIHCSTLGEGKIQNDPQLVRLPRVPSCIQWTECCSVPNGWSDTGPSKAPNAFSFAKYTSINSRMAVAPPCVYLICHKSPTTAIFIGQPKVSHYMISQSRKVFNIWENTSSCHPVCRGIHAPKWFGIPQLLTVSMVSNNQLSSTDNT